MCHACLCAAEVVLKVADEPEPSRASPGTTATSQQPDDLDQQHTAHQFSSNGFVPDADTVNATDIGPSMPAGAWSNGPSVAPSDGAAQSAMPAGTGEPELQPEHTPAPGTASILQGLYHLCNGARMDNT